METNAKLIAVALLVTTLVAPQMQAQNPANPSEPAPPIALSGPGVPPAGGPMGRPGRSGGPGFDQGPGHQPGRLTTLTTISGTVGQWVGNDDAILDGFTLTSGSGTPTTVKFPPHLGEQVQKAIKSGSNVSVTGFSETTPQGETRFRMNSLTAGKTTVYDAPPTPEQRHPTPRPYRP